MKKSLLVVGLVSVLSFAASANDLKTEASKETNILKHKKGWASVLTLKGDRGTGLTIVQGNKQAKGISMKSGSAKVTMSPSYVAAGTAGVPGISRETAAVVFKVEGSKLGGASGTSIALDAKTKTIYWIDASGAVIGELVATNPQAVE